VLIPTTFTSPTLISVETLGDRAIHSEQDAHHDSDPLSIPSREGQHPEPTTSDKLLSTSNEAVSLDLGLAPSTDLDSLPTESGEGEAHHDTTASDQGHPSESDPADLGALPTQSGEVEVGQENTPKKKAPKTSAPSRNKEKVIRLASKGLHIYLNEEQPLVSHTLFVAVLHVL